MASWILRVPGWVRKGGSTISAFFGYGSVPYGSAPYGGS